MVTRSNGFIFSSNASQRLRRHALLLALAFFVLSGALGCVADGMIKSKLPAASSLPRHQPPVPQQVAATEGSLWRGERRSSIFFEDVKARRVGDVITVRIVETSSASKNASTNLNRQSVQSLNIDNLFGILDTLRRKNPNLAGRELFGASTSNDFTGDGSTARSDSLTATITTTVRQVMANGNLYIEGYREITVNNETQYIMLSGVVRPDDVFPDNSVLSTSIADARIAYSGAGLLSDKQKPGFLSVLLDRIWPF